MSYCSTLFCTGMAKPVIASNMVAELMTATRTSRGPLHGEAVTCKSSFFGNLWRTRCAWRSTASLDKRSDLSPANGRLGHDRFRLINSQADSLMNYKTQFKCIMMPQMHRSYEPCFLAVPCSMPCNLPCSLWYVWKQKANHILPTHVPYHILRRVCSSS